MSLLTIRFRPLALGLLGTLVGLAPIASQRAAAVGHETLTPGEATQIGMVSQWQLPMAISGGYQGFVDGQIHVDNSRKRVIFEVSYDDRVQLRFPADMANRFGQPVGEKEAERLAKMETYKLKRIGKEATVTKAEVPQVRLYVVGEDGTVEARDGETGRVIWAARFGDSRLPTTGLTVTDDLVAFTNGLTLYVLDSMTGLINTEYRLKSVPVMAPTIVGNYLMTTGSRRQVEGYALDDLGGERFTAMVAGHPLARPTRAPKGQRMMWPTDSGFVYALDGEGKPGLVFRFPADGLVSSQIAATSGERFFLATEKGQVYGIDATRAGSLLWRQSLGEPVYVAPVVLGEHVLVLTIYGQLHCLNASDGTPAWSGPVSQVSKVLGGDGRQVLVRTATTHLEAIDLKSGSVLTEFFATNIVDSINNPYTDRLYLLTSSGSIQCLRPIDSETPKMLMTEYTRPSEEQTTVDPLEKPKTEQPAIDFGNGADPFGGGGGADPFGGAADPFGGGGDPFGGGGEDPFKGF
jgi:outer membrane protein assembly factor BamB